MKRCRVAAMVGIALVVGSLPRMAGSAPPVDGALDSFAGTWKSGGDGFADPVIAKVTVEVRGAEADLHVWARCAPTDCDWGTVTAQSYRRRGGARRRVSALSGVFSFDGGENLVVLFSGRPDRLHAQVLTRFKDEPSRNVISNEALVREGSSSAADASDPGSRNAPLRVGGRIKEPTKVKHVNPVYPGSAKRDRIQGVVILECTISPEGKVSSVEVLRGPPELVDAAVEAVELWEYTPTLLDGVAVPVIMTVTVNFRLS